MLRIAVYTGGGSPEIVEFPDEGTITFGRSPENNLVLASSYVSRSHGSFQWEDGGWVIHDAGSKVGMVLVRGSERTTLGKGTGNIVQRLSGGETIQILNTLMRVEIVANSASVGSVTESTTNSHSHVAPLAFSQISDIASLQKKLERESRKLGMILDLAKDLNRLVDPDQVLERISRTVFEALPNATHFSICVPGKGDAFVPRFGALVDGTQVRSDQIAVSQSILQLVVEREMAMLFHSTDEDVLPSTSMIVNQIASSMAVPLRGSKGIVGVMQVDNRSSADPFSKTDLDLCIVLANSAAFALERAQFQADIQHMFEGFVDASVTAIEARDPTTSGHSRRVARFSVGLAEAAGRCVSGPLKDWSFSREQLTEIAYAALLHDFGKVGVSEQVLVKANRLYPDQLRRIEDRFAYIRLAYRSSLLLKTLRQQASGAAQPSPEEALRWIEGKCRQFNQHLDETSEFIHRVNTSGRINDEEIERIRQIGAMTFADEQVPDRKFLQGDEIGALSIIRGTLTPEQRHAIESHVTQSFRFLRQIPWPTHLEALPEIVFAHHEKLDGSGYPRKLVGDAIPSQARILTVVDIFDAITASDRPYRSAMPIEKGLDILRWEAKDGKIDTNVVELFIEAKVWDTGARAPKVANMTGHEITVPLNKDALERELKIMRSDAV